MCFERREVQYRKHALKGSINDVEFAEEAPKHKKKAFGDNRTWAEKTILLSWKWHCISFHVYISMQSLGLSWLNYLLVLRWETPEPFIDCKSSFPWLRVCHHQRKVRGTHCCFGGLIVQEGDEIPVSGMKLFQKLLHVNVINLLHLLVQEPV